MKQSNSSGSATATTTSSESSTVPRKVIMQGSSSSNINSSRRCIQQQQTTTTTTTTSNKIGSNGHAKTSDLYYNSKTNSSKQIKEITCPKTTDAKLANQQQQQQYSDYYKNYYISKGYDYYNLTNQMYYPPNNRIYANQDAIKSSLKKEKTGFEELDILLKKKSQETSKSSSSKPQETQKNEENNSQTTGSEKKSAPVDSLQLPILVPLPLPLVSVRNYPNQNYISPSYSPPGTNPHQPYPYFNNLIKVDQQQTTKPSTQQQQQQPIIKNTNRSNSTSPKINQTTQLHTQSKITSTKSQENLIESKRQTTYLSDPAAKQSQRNLHTSQKVVRALHSSPPPPPKIKPNETTTPATPLPNAKEHRSQSSLQKQQQQQQELPKTQIVKSSELIKKSFSKTELTRLKSTSLSLIENNNNNQNENSNLLNNFGQNTTSKLDNLPIIKLKNSYKSTENLISQSVQTQTTNTFSCENLVLKNCQVGNKLINPSVVKNSKKEPQFSSTAATTGASLSCFDILDSKYGVVELSPGKLSSHRSQESISNSKSSANNNNNKTPLLDTLTDVIIPKLAQSVSSSSFTTNQSQMLSPTQSNEFKTSLYVGPDFSPDDINVQLVDNFTGYKVTKKLFVHCFKIEPISSKSLTINAGKLATPTTLDLNISNGNNYLKKELKKDIFIPNNSDINTLESYLENGYLVIKCLLKVNDDSKDSKDERDQATFQNPLYNNSTVQANLQEASNKSILKNQATNSFCFDHESPKDRQARKLRENYKAKRHKSNEALLRTYDDDEQIKDAFECVYNQNNHKSVRFDILNEKSSQRHIQQQQQQNKHRSNSSKSRSNDRLTNNRRANSSSVINDEMIQDGFNCITRDAMDNIFLTYFFKLPSCSPSDRTQVRIENKNILKLKIIQEQNFVSSKKSKRKNAKSKKSKSANTKKNSSLSSSSSSASLSSSISYSSNSKSTSLESILNDSDNSDKTKIMLREFSRQCRLPDNFFKFDESGVTVSFVNNGWVRIEIPILEFFDFTNGGINSKLLNQKLNSNSKSSRKSSLEKQYQKSRHGGNNGEIKTAKIESGSRAAAAAGSVNSNDFVFLNEVRV